MLITMKCSRLYIVIISLFLGVLTSQAQVARKPAVRPAAKAAPKVVKAAPVVPTAADLNFAKLLPSTAKVMFIDSIVTNDNDFLKYIPLSSSCGKISIKKSERGNGNDYYYTNEFEDKRFSSVLKDSCHVLMVEERLGKKWDASKTIELEGVEDIICPYMMSDGVTLYFAAKGGEDSMGQYDIYYTVYDSDSHSFYKPQSLGLPFNSFGDETYYIIDEFNNLGYLVSDRRQPEGKTCVYIFQPTETRETYDVENMPEAELDRLARLRAIKDSQMDETVLASARSRLSAARNSKGAKKEHSFEFIINEKLVYHNISDFRSSVNQSQFPTYLTMKNSVETREKQLEDMRAKYHNGDKNLANTIAQMEVQVFNERQKLNLTEKQIRNTEIEAIGK
jgi:hypothetical protein